MMIRKLNPLYGWKWLRDGWHIFLTSPSLWIAIMALSFFGSAFLLAVPVIGILGFFMLWPVLLGGLLLGVKDLEAGKPLELKHLFAGFKTTPKPLYASRCFIDACQPYEWKHEWYPVVRSSPQLHTRILEKYGSILRELL